MSLSESRELNVVEICEEVVTGDSIAVRPEVQKVLQLVETGNYAGVIVMEVERLARGDTIDQGIIAQTFKYSDNPHHHAEQDLRPEQRDGRGIL